MTDTREASEGQAPKRPKQRSPNHPVIDLSRALERARAIFKEAGIHPVNVLKVHEFWGLKRDPWMGWGSPA